MHVTPTITGLTQFKSMYGRPYTLTELKPFEKEWENRLADYMKQMLTSREVVSANFVPGEPVPDLILQPRDWVLITGPALVGQAHWRF